MQKKFHPTEKKLKDNYKYVADIYDQLMEKVDYKFWAKYLKKLSSLYVKKNARVLELAGGNCSLAVHFKDSYSAYFLSDISFSMLKKCKSESLLKVCCDMTQLPFKSKFDLIICAFDSINYLTNKNLIMKLFREVREVLSDNGVFLFDAALEKNSYIHQKKALKKGKCNGVIFNRQSIYLQASRIHKNIFEIIYPDGTRIKEIHRQKIYPLEFYFNLLDKSGLFVVECFNAFTFRNIKPVDLRAQFVVKRKS